jgi:hypothetical protein
MNISLTGRRSWYKTDVGRGCKVPQTILPLAVSFVHFFLALLVAVSVNGYYRRRRKQPWDKSPYLPPPTCKQPMHHFLSKAVSDFVL